MQKNNPKYIKAWTFYDWANSVYSLVITSAIFPIYYGTITHLGEADEISVLGLKPETASALSLLISFGIVIILSPILSSIADTIGDKKKFLKIFCYLGGLSCIGLYFVDSSNIVFGLFLNITASVGFWGSLVFYNAYLPEIATHKTMDKVSAKGFIVGYIGSLLLLLICLILIQVVAPQSQIGFYTRFCFVLTGIWWMGFAQYTFANLPASIPLKQSDNSIISRAKSELKFVLSEIKKIKNLKIFLAAFFFYSFGMQTLFLMAALFGDKEIGLEVGQLIITILLMQVEAIFGAWLFSYLSKKIGNKITLMLGIIIWVWVCIFGYLINKENPNVTYHFYGIAAMVGLVMGGIQALSRSTYAKMLPKTNDTTTFFSFYDVFEKLALFFGLLTYALMLEYGGGMKEAVLSMGVTFVISFIIMFFFKNLKYSQ